VVIISRYVTVRCCGYVICAGSTAVDNSTCADALTAQLRNQHTSAISPVGERIICRSMTLNRRSTDCSGRISPPGLYVAAAAVPIRRSSVEFARRVA
jgi:hypothetical protein